MPAKGMTHNMYPSPAVIDALAEANGCVNDAADVLGINDPSNLRKLLRLYGITRSRLADGTLVVEHRKGSR